MAEEQFDFDELIARRGTRSLKWDIDQDPDVIELWVADMDFRAAPVILEALQKKLDSGVFGYGLPTKAFYEAIVSWYRKRYGVEFSRTSIIPTTGVVPAISSILQGLCLPGDEVIIQTPAYNCFFSSVRNSGLVLSENALKLVNGRWEIDFEDLEERASREKARALLFCNPQNPTGRVWTRDELTRVAEICEKHGIFLISDEIHGELTAEGFRYTPLASVSPWTKDHVITASAASKAFNIAGLQTAYIIAPVTEVRNRIDRQININEVCDPNPLGIEALIAAYSDRGAAWLDALNHYLDGNRKVIEEFVRESLPGCFLSPQEGTYLPWIDFSSFGKTSTEIEKELLHGYHVRVNGGAHYGETSPGWIRINIATPRARLREGLRRIALWAEDERKKG